MNFLEKLLGPKEDKQAFRAYRKRVDAMPKEYRVVFNELQAYIWNFSLDGSLDMLYELLTFFETGAAEGKPILEITGNDVTGFCDKLIEEWKSRTWQGQMKETFNKKIHKKLENLKHERV